MFVIMAANSEELQSIPAEVLIEISPGQRAGSELYALLPESLALDRAHSLIQTIRKEGEPYCPELARPKPEGAKAAEAGLFAQLQLFGERQIPVHVRAMQIIQQAPALPDQHDQPAPRAMISLVLLQVFGQAIDPLG